MMLGGRARARSLASASAPHPAPLREATQPIEVLPRSLIQNTDSASPQSSTQGSQTKEGGDPGPAEMCSVFCVKTSTYADGGKWGSSKCSRKERRNSIGPGTLSGSKSNQKSSKRLSMKKLDERRLWVCQQGLVLVDAFNREEIEFYRWEQLRTFRYSTDDVWVVAFYNPGIPGELEMELHWCTAKQAPEVQEAIEKAIEREAGRRTAKAAAGEDETASQERAAAERRRSESVGSALSASRRPNVPEGVLVDLLD